MNGAPSGGGGASSGKGRTGASHSHSHSQGYDSSSKRKRGIFQKDLHHMMYGFGDDANVFFFFIIFISSSPLPETVALVEDIVVEYVSDFAHKAQDIGSRRGKLSVEDFLYLVRKDAPKLNRCKELLSMQEELKQARKAFDVDEDKLAASLD